jgi:hypothetical protein
MKRLRAVFVVLGLVLGLRGAAWGQPLQVGGPNGTQSRPVSLYLEYPNFRGFYSTTCRRRLRSTSRFGLVRSLFLYNDDGGYGRDV